MAAEQNEAPRRAQSGLTPKQLAEQARAESEAAERRRERTIRIVGGIVVLLVVGGLLAVGFFAGRDNGTDGVGHPGPDAGRRAQQALPAWVEQLRRARTAPAGRRRTRRSCPRWRSGRTSSARPASRSRRHQAPRSRRWPTTGKVKLLYRPATFLDTSLAATTRPTATPTPRPGPPVPGAARSMPGKTGEYHSAVFAIQPAEEGVGYSDQQLIDLGTTVGIDRATTWPPSPSASRTGPTWRGRRTATRSSSTPASAGPPRPTSTVWSSTAPTLLTSRDSRRRSKPRPRSDRERCATSIPSPDQSVWHLGPLPLRAYALCILVGIFVAMWVGDRRWVARGGDQGPGLRRRRLGGPVRHHRRAALPRPDRLARPTSVPAARAFAGRSPSGRAAWASGARSPSGPWGPGSAADARASRCRPSPTRWPWASPLAQAIGRFGNWFNQELFGKPTDLPVGPGDRPGATGRRATSSSRRSTRRSSTRRSGWSGWPGSWRGPTGAGRWGTAGPSPSTSPPTAWGAWAWRCCASTRPRSSAASGSTCSPPWSSGSGRSCTSS